MNVVLVQGTLSSEPIERTLPGGRNVMDWQVTSIVDGRKRPVPVLWEDPPKRALSISEGDEVVVLGTIRRRFFQAGGTTASRTELVAEQVAKPTQKVAMGKLLDEAREQLAA